MISIYCSPCHDLSDSISTECLSKVEQQKVDRYVFERDRKNSTFAHVFKRNVLARHLSCKPREVAIDLEPGRRPVLSHYSAEQIDFNLSHSRNWVVMAVSENLNRIGVDIEFQRDNLDYAGMAERVFSQAEQKQLASLEGCARQSYFYQIWTIKESISKALGLGMKIGFGKIDINIEGGNSYLKSIPSLIKDWQIVGFELNQTFSLAIALQSITEISQVNIYSPDINQDKLTFFTALNGIQQSGIHRYELPSDLNF
ncbi:MAG: 4'-phosphopantetheinyl transferase [Gammaproteobacteria bacterium]